MNKTALEAEQISASVTALVARLVKRIAWPERRLAMADVTVVLLAGKARRAEGVFGWGRPAVALGLKELQSGIVCVNDLSHRRKPKVEEKHPKLLADIHRIMAPHSQAQSHLRTALAYTNMTATAVHAALRENGWRAAALPTVRTLSNILNRLDYRLRRVERSQVQKNGADGPDFCQSKPGQPGGRRRARNRAHQRGHQGHSPPAALIPAATAPAAGGPSRRLTMT